MVGKNLQVDLAVERTRLANERTFLSYLRTGLAFTGAGLFLLKFFEDSTYSKTSWAFVLVGVTFVLYGAYRFHKYSMRIDKNGNKLL